MPASTIHKEMQKFINNFILSAWLLIKLICPVLIPLAAALSEQTQSTSADDGIVIKELGIYPDRISMPAL